MNIQRSISYLTDIINGKTSISVDDIGYMNSIDDELNELIKEKQLLEDKVLYRLEERTRTYISDKKYYLQRNGYKFIVLPLLLDNFYKIDLNSCCVPRIIIDFKNKFITMEQSKDVHHSFINYDLFEDMKFLIKKLAHIYNLKILI